MPSEMQAMMLSADPEGDLRSAYDARIAAARLQARPPRPPADRLRILLAGYSGAANTGADLRTGEIIRQLRAEFGADRLDLGLLVVGEHKLPFQERLEVERIEGYPPDCVHDLCTRYDAVVVCEGSLFTSTFADSLAMLLTAFLGMATALGKPAVAYGAEVDRMSPEIAAFVRCHATAALLIARNAASLARLEQMGLAAELGTDTGWSYRPRHPEAADAALRALGWNGTAELLVLCPTNPFRWPLVTDPAKALLASLTGQPESDHYRGMMFFQPAEISGRRCAAFLAAMAQAVRDHAARRSAGVFPVIVGMEANDRQACIDLAERLGAAKPLVAGDVAPDLIVATLYAAARLVSARYHAVLLGMTAGVPAVGLAYDQRVRALLSDAGHAELALEVDDPDLTAALVRALDRLATHRPALSGAFSRFAARQQDVQAAMSRRVAAYLTEALP
ncbi:MAG: polysaccharide pyruvyl transferase family protein [Xanthobacteraceae bacterium]